MALVDTLMTFYADKISSTIGKGGKEIMEAMKRYVAASADTGDFKADGSVPLTGDIDFAGSQQCHDLQAPAVAGEAIRQTAKITEAALETTVDHGTATTAVHGVGAGTIAKTADITATKLDALTAPDDNTTLDASTSRHGLLLKATAPNVGLYNYVGITNAETAYTDKALFDATVPSTQAIADAAATGTAAVAARRDHKHAMPSAATMDASSVAAIAAAGFTLADAKYITFTDPSVDHTFSGFVKSHKAHENLVFSDVCFENGDEEMVKANAAAIATMPAVCICVATAGIAANASGLVMLWGLIHDDHFAFAHTGGAANKVYVSAATAGLATTTRPSGSVNVVQPIGDALATDELFFHPDNTYLELVA